jgi:hypothetical protein
MSDKKISALTSLAQGDVAVSTDVLPIVDTSATETKKVTAAALVGAGLTAGVTNVDINSGSIDGTTIGANSAAAGTFTNLTASGTVSFSGATVSNGGSVTTVDINGGTIDGASIGASSASTGSFTTLTTSSTVTLNGGTANGVLYLNGSKVATSGSALTFDGTNFGTTGNANLGSVSKSTDTQLNFASDLGTQRIYLDRGTRSLVFYDATTAIENYRIAGITGIQTWGVGGSEQMRLTSTGLGIGTSSFTWLASGSETGVNIKSSGTNAAGISVSSSNANNTRMEMFASYTLNQGGFYLKGDSAYPPMIFGQVNGSTYRDSMLLDASGNLGLGVTPSAWETANSVRALQLNGGNVSSFSNAYIWVGQNWYRDSASAERYVNTAAATKYQQAFGAHSWYTAASGTAGNAISFTQAMTLDASGQLALGTSTASSTLGRNLTINGANAGTNSGIVLQSATTERGYVYASDTQMVLGSSTSIPVLMVTGGSERARITTGGEFLVGTTNTSASAGNGVKIVSQNGGQAAGGVFAVGNYGGSDIYPFMAYSSSASAFRFYVDYAGNIYATNTSIISLSDQRLKENIRDLDVGLDAVMALKPRKFDWKAGKGKDKKDDRGFIAQEFEQVFPDLINEWKDPAPEGEQPYKTVRQDLIPVLVKAMQEQQAMINELKAEVAALKGA